MNDAKDWWNTQWGPLYMQGARGDGGRQIYYVEWHSSASKDRPTKPSAGGTSPRRVSAQIQAWVDANGGEKKP